MPDNENIPQTPQGDCETPTEPIVYASPIKRVWAWVGVAYMVVIVFLITYLFAFGAYLQGIGALMVCPALVGVAVSAVLLWRQGARNKTFVNRLVLAVIIGLCGGLVVLNLWNGIPALITNFGVK